MLVLRVHVFLCIFAPAHSSVAFLTIQPNAHQSRRVTVCVNQMWLLLCSQGDAEQDQSKAWVWWASDFKCSKAASVHACICACTYFVYEICSRAYKNEDNTATFDLSLKRRHQKAFKSTVSFHSIMFKTCICSRWKFIDTAVGLSFSEFKDFLSNSKFVVITSKSRYVSQFFWVISE